MAKGTDFEKKALDYLKFLFQELGFKVTEARQQHEGTQNGFDIRIGFIDEGGNKRNFYFECKNYESKISWDAIIVKISQLDASSHLPDGYIALSPHVDFSNININVLEKLAKRVQFPIVYWTPDTNIKEYFSLDASLYKYLYGSKPVIRKEEKDIILQKIRHIITDMLRQKDNPVTASFTKELTLKIPRIHQNEIIGRADELEELHELLFSNKQVVVVNGLGGIGKTTLAQGYISKYLKDYKNVAWITQLSEDIVNDITNTEGLAESLKISRQGKEAGQLFNEIISQLKAIPDSPNLLILDNVDENLAKLKDYLPGQPHWHVLTTSRNRIEGFYTKVLDFLSPEKAIALFKKHCPQIIQEDQIADVVKIVDYHTLTIEILAKTAQRHRTNIEILKKAIKNDLKSHVYIEHKGEKIDKVRSYLSSIFNLSSLNEDETWLMKQFTCLPAEYHTYERLIELIDPDENRIDVLADICNRLVEQGWLLYNAETGAYKMHLIVQEVAVRQLLPGVNDIGRLMDKITLNLRIDETKDNPVDKFKWIPCGYVLLNNFQNDTSAKIAVLQNNLALVLKVLGDYVGARVLLEKAIQSAEQNFGPDHPATAVRYSNLAMVLKHLGDYSGARVLSEKALRSAEQNFGPDHPTTATRYSNLALVLKDLGDYAGSRVLSEKALRSDEENFGPDHPKTAVRYSNLAMVLKDLGDYAGARVLLEKALRSAEQNFGPDHPTTATRYSNLGLVLKDLGDYAGARVLLEKAVQSDEQNFGPDHPTTAVSYSNLALVLKGLGDYAGARVLLEKAVRSDEQNFGPDHPMTAIRYSNLGLVLRNLGDYAEARVLLEKAMRSDEQNFGPDHPLTAVSYSNLGLVLRNLGDYAEARVLMEKAVQSDEQNFGLDHPTTAMSYSNLAMMLQALSEYAGALELAEKGLTIFKKVLPENHPYIDQAQRVYDSIKASF